MVSWVSHIDGSSQDASTLFSVTYGNPLVVPHQGEAWAGNYPGNTENSTETRTKQAQSLVK